MLIIDHMSWSMEDVRATHKWTAILGHSVKFRLVRRYSCRCRVGQSENCIVSPSSLLRVNQLHAVLYSVVDIFERLLNL